MRAYRLIKRALLSITLFGFCMLGMLNQPAIAQIKSVENPPTPASERVSFQRKALPMIPPGTRFGERPPQGWSNLISFARVKLTSGDVASVSDTVRYYAELFNLTMLANADENADGKFELDKVAIGFSMQIQGVNTIVTPQTEAELGGKLSLIGRSVLSVDIDSLGNVQQVARTTHSIVIDAPAIILREGKHREMVVRYYIWVFPDNGHVGTLVWLLDPSGDGSRLSVADTTAQLLPANMHEDRVMDVDAEKFGLFGIPTKTAFALVQIPQGVPFEMTEKMQSIAAEKNYTPTAFATLSEAIAQTLRAGAK